MGLDGQNVTYILHLDTQSKGILDTGSIKKKLYFLNGPNVTYILHLETQSQGILDTSI